MRLILLASAVILAATPQQDPWELSIAQRLAARAEARIKVQTNADDGAESKRRKFLIDGSTDAHLFMPYELMTFLLDTHDLPSSSRSTARQRYHDAIVSLQWNETAFWADIDEAAAGYHAAVMANQGRNRTEAASRSICAMRTGILRNLRIKYPKFDQFLYGAFARSQTLVGQDDESSTWLAWVDGGCR